MRNNIVHRGADELTYEIREIVAVGEKLENFGINIIWENIGDPIAKGERVPDWIKNIVKSAITDDDTSFGYSPTKGLLETRKFIAELQCSEGIQLDSDDILFFNGLGDAISIIYTQLSMGSRIIGPNPTYQTHSSFEAAHARLPYIYYNLNPNNNWLPDLEDLRNKVKYNPSISGILIINPDNPTGMVYPKRVLEKIVSIAREFDLFIISDEIYSNIVYGNEEMVPINKLLGNTPAIVMRGLSKEIPWPGARCGWVEFYNKEKDKVFARYAKSLVDAKQLEVCSTTLPQKVLPKIFKDARYGEYLRNKATAYGRKADIAYNAFSKIHGMIAPKPSGAFYLSVVFDDGVLTEKQTLRVENTYARKFIGEVIDNITLDKRFTYYLMASTGICVVPLSSFNSNLHGFRMTLLEPNEEKFQHIVHIIAKKVEDYLNS